MKTTTWTIWNGKGGASKTTLAVAFSHLHHEEKPLLLDLDIQKSTHRYREVLTAHNVSMRDVESSDFYGSGLPNAPLRIIDCPPDFDVAAPALECADVIVVPFTGDSDVWSATVEAWQRIQKMRHNAIVVGVMSHYLPGSGVDREILAEARKLMGSQLLSTVIRRREVMRDAAHRRLTIFDTLPDSPAAKQIRAVDAEIQSRLKK